MKFLFDPGFPSDASWKRWRYYKTWADVKRARKMLIKQGWNYFVLFKDVRGPALEFGKADWVPEGRVHTDW